MKSKIITGDVIEVLQSLPAGNKFDLVIADPPYNIGKDFGTTKDRMPLDKYVEWVQEWVGLCLNLLTENGIIYVYGFSEILAHISVKYDIKNQHWLVWHYTNKNTPVQFWQRSHESIFVTLEYGKKKPKT